MIPLRAAYLRTPGAEERAIELPPSAPLAAAPRVSCLMVSRGSLFPARHAVECFLRQTHPNRELVVVVDDPGCALRAHVLALGDPRIRLVDVADGSRTLGDLRNIAVAHARGEYVCQWDDDDLYAPQRIEVQLAALIATGSAACLLRRWTLWWPQERRIAESGARAWEGSILARKCDLPPYPPLRRGEDTEMVDALLGRARVVCLDAPELYVYIHHGANTTGRAHFTSLYNYSRRRWTGPRCDEALEHLGATLPVRDFQAGLTGAGGGEVPGRTQAEMTPRVSIIVRSMGRRELSAALASLAAQDYPALDVIVVDATGGAHPALPDVAWQPGHTVRLVGGERPLTRPQAANVGIDAVRGQWFGFLDDDDTFDPDHVSTLMALTATTGELAVYGMSRLLDARCETTSQVGLPFNREAVFLAPLCSFPAALFDRAVLARGCRVDESFELFEDQDFVRQVSLVSGFARSEVATFNYHIEAGTSGTGRGANRAWVRSPLFAQRLRAKWAGPGTYHARRVLGRIRRAARAFHVDGDPARARTLLQSLLDAYPDEPNALNAIGSICLATGDLAEAETFLRRAIDINPTAGEYRYHLGCVLHRSGRPAEAVRELRAAATDLRLEPELRAVVIDQLGHSAAVSPAPPPPAVAPAAASSRTALCGCGSGKRYKHCCGRLRPPPGGNGADATARRALDAFAAGEADAAIALLDGLVVADLADVDAIYSCAEILREMRHHERACAFLGQAVALGEAFAASAAADECGSSWYRPEREASLLRMARDQARRIDRRRHLRAACGPDDATIHVVGAFGKIGGSEHRAYGLYRWLVPHARVRLWSTVAPLPEVAASLPIETIDMARGTFPKTGHFVFAGVYFAYGAWLERSRPARVTICYNTPSAEELVARLVALEDIDPGFALDFTFPSRSFHARSGMPGVVEYAPVDTARFRPRQTRKGGARPLAIGRHSRDDPLKFHPNDPAFLRALVRDGHRVEIVGGTCLGSAFASGAGGAGVTLRAETDDVVPFLEGLDVFVYRVHPEWQEAGGTAIMEAMAMALPVIVFADRVGIAELIEHGRNGFRVDTQAQALALVRELRHDPALREKIGAAARATIVARMEQQRRALLDFYLPRHAGPDAGRAAAAPDVSVDPA